jgi:predicted enzyme related to lactoylglutathione lyase
MKNNIKYVHTNIIAKDWRKLSKFYIDVFDCKPLYPERDLSGKWIDKVTNIDNVKVKGIHLKLPGYEDGPTLEIFSYKPENLNNQDGEINRQGFGHLAFLVDDFTASVEKLLSNGGTLSGEIQNVDYEKLGHLEIVYCKDPEGNFLEIQKWS